VSGESFWREEPKMKSPARMRLQRAQEERIGQKTEMKKVSSEEKVQEDLGHLGGEGQEERKGGENKEGVRKGGDAGLSQ